MSESRSADLAQLNTSLRESSRDMYLATLLMPMKVRDLACALFSYHTELTNVGYQVSEPIAGSIRLQWWAEVLAGERAGEAQLHPLARTLSALLSKHDVSSKPLVEKAHAHEFDLYAEPMESRGMLEGYFGETRSVLFQILGMAIGEPNLEELATASGHAGVSTGCVATVLEMERQRSAGRITVPQDLLRACGIADDAYLSGSFSDLNTVRSAMSDFGLEHHQKAVLVISNLDSATQSLFRLCALSPAYFSAFSSSEKQVHPFGQLRTQWKLFREKL